MGDKTRRVLSILGEIAGRLGCAAPFLAVGLWFSLYGVIWGILVVDKLTATTDVLGPCDVPGTVTFLGGFVFVGAGFFLAAGLILAPLVLRREITNSNWIKGVVAVVILGVIAIMGGAKYGSGCPVIN